MKFNTNDERDILEDIREENGMERIEDERGDELRVKKETGGVQQLPESPELSPKVLGSQNTSLAPLLVVNILVLNILLLLNMLALFAI